MKKWLSIFLMTLNAGSVFSQAAQASNAQKAWSKMAYGMFIHFGPNTIQGVNWGKGDFDPVNFKFKQLDVAQWARTARRAKMKYAVLTAKHHDGFCLWNSRFTDYGTSSSPSGLDVVKAFVTEFKKQGIRVGLYYSLWDRHFKDYENDSLYNVYVARQLTELCTNYGEITEFWFDGAWDKDFPSRSWEYRAEWETEKPGSVGHGERWGWKQIYTLIHKLQPNCLVIMNSSSDRPGQVSYPPVDARTSEHFDFIYKEKICRPQLRTQYNEADGRQVYLPLEFCTTLTPGWFWKPQDYFLHPSVATILGWYKTARKSGANLLLNVGPNQEGLIPEYNREYLTSVAKYLP